MTMSSTAGDRIRQAESGSADTVDILTPSPSGESIVVPRNATPTIPMSPPRTQQQPMLHISVPNSPAPLSVGDRSPSITPTQQRQQQQQKPWAPQTAGLLAPTGVVLGLEQLERQQDEAERRRREQLASTSSTSSSTEPPRVQLTSRSQQRPHSQQQSSPVVTIQQQHRYLEDDYDDHTAPSSTLESSGTVRDAGSQAGTGSLGSADDASAAAAQQKESTKLGRMIKKTRRRLSSNDFLRRRNELDDPAEEEEDEVVDALIYGHLQKLGRNGKWQTRWFETDGECLSYYKSSKRTKLLATLDLEKVGGIVVNEDDPKGCSFTIQVLGRPYYLRAESRAACKDWVITLNRVKEAKLQQGNVSLVHQHKNILFRSPPDLLDRNVSTYTPGVVAQANRQRTRAVDEAGMDNIEEMILKGGNEPGDEELADGYYNQTEDNDTLSQVVLARWHKRKTSMSRLASKLSRWAKSLNKYKCSDVENNDVHLDRQIHPPGHDNAPKRLAKTAVEPKVRAPQNDPALKGWIGKEASLAAKGGPVVIPLEDVTPGIDQAASDAVSHSAPPASSVTGDEDDGEETRELS